MKRDEFNKRYTLLKQKILIPREEREREEKEERKEILPLGGPPAPPLGLPPGMNPLTGLYPNLEDVLRRREQAYVALRTFLEEEKKRPIYQSAGMFMTSSELLAQARKYAKKHHVEIDETVNLEGMGHVPNPKELKVSVPRPDHIGHVYDTVISPSSGEKYWIVALHNPTTHKFKGNVLVPSGVMEDYLQNGHLNHTSYGIERILYRGRVLEMDPITQVFRFVPVQIVKWRGFNEFGMVRRNQWIEHAPV